MATVIAAQDLPSDLHDPILQSASGRHVKLRIDEVFGERPAEGPEVEVLTGWGSGDCGVPFITGERFLVSSYRGDDGQLHASICGITRRIEDAGPILAVLRAKRDGQRVPTLTGVIARSEWNFESRPSIDDLKSLKSLDSMFRAVAAMDKTQPIPDVLVRLKSDKQQFETRSDSKGVFTFFDVQAGQYEFVPELPSGFITASFLGSESPARSVEIDAGTCQVRNLTIVPSASIKGSVLNASGKVLPHAQVFLYPEGVALDVKRFAFFDHWQSQSKGFFQFLHLSPGRYFLVVNPSDTKDASFPYARTYYPDVHDSSLARAISVGEGEQVTGADIRLEEAFKPRPLKVRIAWQNGEVVSKWVQLQMKNVTNPLHLPSSRQPDQKVGIIDAELLPGEIYEISASVSCTYWDDAKQSTSAITLTSNTVFLQPDDARTELTLTLPGTNCPVLPGKRPLNY